MNKENTFLQNLILSCILYQTNNTSDNYIYRIFVFAKKRYKKHVSAVNRFYLNMFKDSAGKKIKDAI